MKKRCWNCKKWEEHFYWDHLDESSFRFMKVMDGDYSQRMEFPLKFSKMFRVDLLDVVTLKGPTDQPWEIGLLKEQDHFYFTGGWKQFIEANKIAQGHTLIFEYTGNSSFAVQIFDQTGCLRVDLDIITNARKKKEVLDQPWKNHQTSNSSKVRNDNPMLHEISDNKSTSSRRNDRRVGPSRICKIGHNDLDSGSSSKRKTGHSNSQDPVEILQLNFAGKQSNCSFVKLIKQSNLIPNPFMTIPIKFLSKHIPRKPYGITICNGRKKWFLKCKWRKPSWGFIGKSLFNFLQENNLKQGDACVFKIKERSKKVVMEMSVVVAKEVDSIMKNSWL